MRRVAGHLIRIPAAALFLATISASAQLEAASYPPGYRFRTVSNERISVHFHDPLEPQAREAASIAREILAGHERRYGQNVGRLELVLVDVDDQPNGYATPLPFPIVNVRAVAPEGTDGFGNHEGWLRLVLAHELAHSVHLEEARGLWAIGRRLFGRAPFLFPNTFAMSWMIEGLATYEETELTAFGRGRNPDSRMVLRMAALDGRFPKEDQAIYALDAWPGGQTAYLFGEALLRRVSEQLGPRRAAASRASARRPVSSLARRPHPSQGDRHGAARPVERLRGSGDSRVRERSRSAQGFGPQRIARRSRRAGSASRRRASAPTERASRTPARRSPASPRSAWCVPTAAATGVCAIATEAPGWRGRRTRARSSTPSCKSTKRTACSAT